MQAFEAISISQLVTVTGGDGQGQGASTTVKGKLDVQLPGGIGKGTGEGEYSTGTGEKVQLMRETVDCAGKRDPAWCLDVLKTVQGQPSQPQTKQP